MKYNKFISFVFILSFLTSCKNDVNQNPTMTNASSFKTYDVTLRQEWFPYSGYAGELMAVNETGKSNNINITLEAGSDIVDPLKLVISGQNDFGVASADRILQANEKGAELVVVGVINYKSPTCYLTTKESNIISPQDFSGNTVGILTGTNTELIYRILKDKTGIKNINEVEIPFDLATFIAGKYDVRPAFIYDETVSLDLKGIDYNIIEPEKFGIEFIGTVYFTKKSTVEENPKMVQAFVNAIAEGWKKAIQNPEKAIDYLKKYDVDIDTERELLSLKKGIPYFQGENNKILYASRSRWESMARNLLEIGYIKNFSYDDLIIDLNDRDK